MRIPRTARYDYCVYKAHEFLLYEEINKFPIDIDSLIQRHKWATVKYSELALKHSATIEEIQDTFSEDGYTIFNGRNYTIAFNDNIASKDRVYFTKTHEVGHIALNHFSDFDQTILERSTLTQVEYKVLENEANCFTRNVIAPAVIVYAMRLFNPRELSKFFGISLDAAKVRLSFLESDLYWISKAHRQIQLSFFHEIIHKKACTNCGNTFVSDKAKFCPICGHHRLYKGDGFMIYSDGFKLDENGRAYTCPKCGNEEMGTGTEFCRICGTYIVNRCSKTDRSDTVEGWLESCGEVAHRNSRYCEICGAPTTFFNQNFLMPWTDMRQLIVAREVAATRSKSKESDNEIPF